MGEDEVEPAAAAEGTEAAGGQLGVREPQKPADGVQAAALKIRAQPGHASSGGNALRRGDSGSNGAAGSGTGGGSVSVAFRAVAFVAIVGVRRRKRSAAVGLDQVQ